MFLCIKCKNIEQGLLAGQGIGLQLQTTMTVIGMDV